MAVIYSPPPPDHELHIDGDITFQGEISWSARENSIDARIWAENIGTNSARIETGTCAFNIIAYNADGEPVWYNRMPEDYVCFDELLVYTFDPGQRLPLSDQSYLNGTKWANPIPAGNWKFEARAFTAEGDTVAFELNWQAVFNRLLNV